MQPIRSGTVFEPPGPGDPPLIGGYRVLARIGEGRTGRVHLGTTQSGRPLAIKVIRDRFAGDAAFRRRFKQEIAGAQRARGPYLARVVDGHAEGQLPWVAAEYVAGPTLEDAVAEVGPLPVPAVRALVAAIAEALRSLHEADLVHGDLRPSNILLAAGGPRLTDFGSLEHPTTPAGEVFALGNVALYAATGHGKFPRPFHFDPTDFSGCPDELRGLIERCLAPEPDDRPEPAAIIAELEEGPPGPDWLPAEISALLPAYEPGAPPEAVPEAVREVAPKPQDDVPAQPEAGERVRLTKPDVPNVPAPAPARQQVRPNFAVPLPPEQHFPPAGPPATIPNGPPIMGSYRNDLAIALAIGGGAFGILVLVLMFAFLL
ncbi:protein kinase [Actinomadura sp. 9N407]|uniref:serine/threonine-protein kinase n=1 Tax=Actinomadura sp. 9N407 TaxID=3375154 RepID=UPI00379CCD51